jgi:Ion channel
MVDLESQAMNKAQQDVMTLFNTNSDCNCSRDDPLQEDDFVDIEEAIRQIQPQQRQYTQPKSNWCPMMRSSFAYPTTTMITTACRRQRENYKLVASKKHKLEPTPRLYHVIYLHLQFGFFLIFLLVLSVLIGHKEGWNFGQTFYFAITTSCTIGYGDAVPSTQFGKLLVVLFIPAAVGASKCRSSWLKRLVSRAFLVY